MKRIILSLKLTLLRFLRKRVQYAVLFFKRKRLIPFYSFFANVDLGLYNSITTTSSELAYLTGENYNHRKYITIS